MTELIEHLTFADYVAIDALNKSSAMHLLRSPAHFQAYLAAERKETAALNRGLALHCKLSDDRHCLAVAPQVDRRTKAGKAAWEAFQAEASGKIIVTPDVDDQTEAMAEAIATHPIAGQYLVDGRHEVTALFDYDDVACKARIDCLTTDAIVDWKTIDSVEQAERSAAAYHYDLQAAWYQQSVYRATGERLPFVFVFVESAAPFGVRVLEAGETMLDRGMTHMHQVITRYRECMQTGIWPGYEPEVGTLELPGYAQLRIDDAIAW